MNIEKMREEFEFWAKQKGLSIGLNWNNSYSHVALIAWDAWQASRESLVIELPDAEGCSVASPGNTEKVGASCAESAKKPSTQPE